MAPRSCASIFLRSLAMCMSTVRVWIRSTCCSPHTSTSSRRRLTMRPRSRANSASSATSRAVSSIVRGRTRRCARPDRSRQAPNANGSGGGGARTAAAQQRLDARHQLGDRERLGDVVVGAAAKAFQHVGFRAARRQHQDRLLAVGGRAARGRRRSRSCPAASRRAAPARSAPPAPAAALPRRISTPVGAWPWKASTSHRPLRIAASSSTTRIASFAAHRRKCRRAGARVNGALPPRSRFTFILPSESSLRASHLTDFTRDGSTSPTTTKGETHDHEPLPALHRRRAAAGHRRSGCRRERRQPRAPRRLHPSTR